MPIQRCQRNNEEGWQWGDEGKCYLPSEEGSDDNAKDKAIEQAIASGARPDEFQQQENIAEFAALKNVEIFRPGTHNGMEFSQEEIDEMIASSNACLPFILQSIEQGEYAGNDALNAEMQASGKPIPALINLGHQRYLKDVKTLLKDVQIEFGKAGDWVIANISNVKDDIALMLQEVFNSRSVELIKELFNPLDGNTYRNVIRSIGFLPANIPPAVSGQNLDMAVEFAKTQGSYLVTLYSQKDEEPLKKEEHIMPKEMNNKDVAGTEEATVMSQNTQPAMVHDEHEQEAKQALSKEEKQKIAHEFNEKLIEMQEKFELEQKEKQALKRRLEIVEMQAAESAKQQDAQAIELFCKELRAGQLKDEHGNTYIASEAFIESVKPLIQHADNSNVVEFSAEQKHTTRQAIQGLTKSVLDMAAKGTLLVPVNVAAFQQNYTPPEQTKKPKEVNGTTIMEFYGDEAKRASAPDASERAIQSKAWDLGALDDYRRIYGEV